MSQEAPRVGIVLVSHSVRLAEGAADLAGQVSGGTVRVLAAGGTEDGGLGTSAEKVAQAVAGADAGAGVLVLPDLGSAVLTVRAMLAETGGLAETGEPADIAGPADTPGARVVLADAPFVEGAVAATVTAAAGADLKAVARAAEEAWHARKL
jgi:PTS hybrid protein